MLFFYADKNKKFDYISVTPPYLEVDYPKLMDQLSRSPLVGEDCFMVRTYLFSHKYNLACQHLFDMTNI
jgi:Conserved hypothetical protein 95